MWSEHSWETDSTLKDDRINYRANIYTTKAVRTSTILILHSIFVDCVRSTFTQGLGKKKGL